MATITELATAVGFKFDQGAFVSPGGTKVDTPEQMVHVLAQEGIDLSLEDVTRIYWDLKLAK